MNNLIKHSGTMSLLFLLIYTSASAQSDVKIYGTISDANSQEALPNASIYDMSTFVGAVSNLHGYYTLSIHPKDSVQLLVSFIGYQSQLLNISLSTDTLINIQLQKGVEIEEFKVIAKRYQSMAKETGITKMPIKDIIYNPVFMGEANLISSLKTLPSVSSGKEGGSELFVRGGNYDQNLILLDEAPIYNLNHAFGLLSVFNASTLKSVDLYKGGIPASYGGRLSSVLDVTSREGNKKEYGGELSLSTLSGAFTFEGPIIKDKASFLFSARRSWVDQLVMRAMSDEDVKMALYFYDINAKVNFTVKEKHNFFMSYYTGKDELNARVDEEESNFAMHQGWGNQLGSVRYNTILNNGSFLNLSTYYTQFEEYDVSDGHTDGDYVEQASASTLKELGFKGDINWSLNSRLTFKTGIEASWRGIEPSHKTATYNGDITQINAQENQEQLSYVAFASSIYKYNKLKLELGLRGTVFQDKVQTNTYLEPRLNASYQLSEALKLKLGAMRNVQPLYAMRKNNNGFPGYTWLPLTNGLMPQEAWQSSTGFNWQKGSWMIDVEAYYKHIYKQASNYRFPYDIYGSSNWYELIDQGEGRAYGLEFLGTYNNHGWDLRLSYTLARAQSKYDEINNGEWFNFDYDIRHELSLVASKVVYNRDGIKRWFTSSFSLHSGTPVSMPTHTANSAFPIFAEDEYYSDLTQVDYYNQPNNARMPLYHRLDIGFNMEKQKDRGSRTWSVGVINAYNKQNPYIYYRSDKGQFQQLTMFPIMPYVSFKRSF
ncbi:TonB-dependent receptor [Saccharicrinis aurantiacus]|uniref:TonB-dependent receptor n=1 Tax=Saccharicrinis aurantiacus TaxID=1849719 RepID=UPI000838E8A9|nr:TonB-dependent receptor [Saccharicrinis aurantiacus]